MMTMNYFIVQTPSGSVIWFGSIQPAKGSEVWLTAPNGKKIWTVPADCVRQATRKEVIERLRK